jgi:hypothetical protein
MLNVKSNQIALLLSVGLMFLPGCSTPSENQQQLNQPTNSNPTTVHNPNSEIADLNGEITKIISNQITLKLIEMPNFARESGGQGRTRSQSENNNKKNDQQRKPEIINPQDQKYQGNRQQTRQPDDRQIKYTGETANVTIPESVSISTTIRTSKGREYKDLGLNELKVGDIIQIWYQDKESKSIAKISVRQQTNNTTKDTTTPN